MAAVIEIDKGKPVERRGRKASGLRSYDSGAAEFATPAARAIFAAQHGAASSCCPCAFASPDWPGSHGRQSRSSRRRPELSDAIFKAKLRPNARASRLLDAVDSTLDRGAPDGRGINSDRGAGDREGCGGQRSVVRGTATRARRGGR